MEKASDSHTQIYHTVAQTNSIIKIKETDDQSVFLDDGATTMPSFVLSCTPHNEA